MNEQYTVKLTASHLVFQIVKDDQVMCGVHIGNYDNNFKAAEAFAWKIARLLNESEGLITS